MQLRFPPHGLPGGLASTLGCSAGSSFHRADGLLDSLGSLLLGALGCLGHHDGLRHGLQTQGHVNKPFSIVCLQH